LTVAIAGKPAATDAVPLAAGEAVYVVRGGRQTVVRFAHSEGQDAGGASGGAVTAPMDGKLLVLLVAAGDPVHKGQRVAILEAMKMEHALLAPIDGVVTEVLGEAGKQMAERATVLVIAPKE